MQRSLLLLWWRTFQLEDWRTFQLVSTVGGWLNEENDSFYFDSIRIFTNLEEAKQFGRENKQIAIFDLTHLRLIKL